MVLSENQKPLQQGFCETKPYVNLFVFFHKKKHFKIRVHMASLVAGFFNQKDFNSPPFIDSRNNIDLSCFLKMIIEYFYKVSDSYA